MPASPIQGTAQRACKASNEGAKGRGKVCASVLPRRRRLARARKSSPPSGRASAWPKLRDESVVGRGNYVTGVTLLAPFASDIRLRSLTCAAGAVRRITKRRATTPDTSITTALHRTQKGGVRATIL